jgi:ligand-binding sensor domain-containing protein
MRYLFPLILLLSVAGLRAQPLLFENYSSQQGLSQNSCYSIAQDADGFMWFGTQDGLNRYDGKEFKPYLPQTAEGKKLPSNYISTLFFSKDENLLWVGTMGGLCLYLPGSRSLAAIEEVFPFALPLKTTAIKAINSFAAGEYWIATYNSGLIYVNTKTKKLQSYLSDAAFKNQMSSIIFHNGKIIAATLHALFILTRTANGFKPEALLPAYNFPEIKALHSFNGKLWIGTLTDGCYYIEAPMTSISDIRHFNTGAGGIGCFTTDASGNLWIGSRGSGVIRYTPATGQLVTAIHNRYDSRSLEKNFVLSLFTDRQGIMWCGLSGAGLAKYDPLKFQIHTTQHEDDNPKSLPDNMVFDIFRSSAGHYYVGTQNNGIAAWDRQNGSFTPIAGTSISGAPANTIYDITEDDQQNLWIASWAGLMEFDPDTKQMVSYRGKISLPSEKFYTILKLKNADSLLLMGEDGAVFFSLRDYSWHPCLDNILQNNLFTGRYIYEDSNNVLWICTTGAGLVKYDTKTRISEIIEPVRNISVNARHLLEDGNLFWIATDNGIVVYDTKTGKIVRHILPNNENASKVCYAIQKDKSGDFWVSSNTGLYRISHLTYTVEKHYNLGNGLSFLEYNTACGLTADEGALLFGGVDGITEINPSLIKENTYTPAPLITGITVNKKAVGIAGLHLRYNENFIAINFTVPNFSNESNNLFMWRLKGLNGTWSSPTPINSATFAGLPPGDYTFELRAANSDGKWAPGITSLPLVIRAPWWQTWAFRIAAALLLAVLIFYFVRKRIQSLRKEAALKQQMAELEMKGLHAQMNPHFIFNSLNSIKEMIWSDDKQNASRYLSKFAQLIRTGLEQSKQTFITVEQCRDHLQQYLDMEKLRFEGFSYSIITDEKLDVHEAKIAPLLVQPLVENAIWHGLGNKDGDRQLFIRFLGDSHNLSCEIEDNGIGIRQLVKNKQNTIRTHHSLGIANIKERLEKLNEKYNMKCSLTITDKSDEATKTGSGTIAVLHLTS